MKSCIIHGVEYKSLAECCRHFAIPYTRVKRLCRHYQSAQVNPSLAVMWVLGEVPLLDNEPKTVAYYHDLGRGARRQDRFRRRLVSRIENYFGA